MVVARGPWTVHTRQEIGACRTQAILLKKKGCNNGSGAGSRQLDARDREVV
jgi:hypothetical protein